MSVQDAQPANRMGPGSVLQSTEEQRARAGRLIVRISVVLLGGLRFFGSFWLVSGLWFFGSFWLVCGFWFFGGFGFFGGFADAGAVTNAGSCKAFGCLGLRVVAVAGRAWGPASLAVGLHGSCGTRVFVVVTIVFFLGFGSRSGESRWGSGACLSLAIVFFGRSGRFTGDFALRILVFIVVV